MTDQQLSQIFKALANPNRLQIYRAVMASDERGMSAPEAGCGVADLIHKLKVGAPTVSHHVHALQDVGLIRVERRGKYVHCYPNMDLAADIGRFWQQLLP